MRQTQKNKQNKQSMSQRRWTNCIAGIVGGSGDRTIWSADHDHSRGSAGSDRRGWWGGSLPIRFRAASQEWRRRSMARSQSAGRLRCRLLPRAGSFHGLGPTASGEWLRCALRRFPSSGVCGRQFTTALDKLLLRHPDRPRRSARTIANVVHVQFICTVVLSHKCSIA